MTIITIKILILTIINFSKNMCCSFLAYKKLKRNFRKHFMLDVTAAQSLSVIIEINGL